MSNAVCERYRPVHGRSWRCFAVRGIRNNSRVGSGWHRGIRPTRAGQRLLPRAEANL